jgi:hypothetical protein
MTTREELEQIRAEAQRGWLKGEDCSNCVRMARALLAALDECERPVPLNEALDGYITADAVRAAIEREIGHEGRAK